jgi:glycosyl hydrolase family 12
MRGSSKILRASAAALASVLAVVIAPQAGRASSSPAATHTRICRVNGHTVVHNRSGTQFEVRDAYWLGQRPQCLTVRDHYTNFKVAQRAGYDPVAGRVVAYPDILRGCIWHICSPKAHMPLRVTAVGHPKLTWYTKGHPKGTWNAAFDIWFGKKKMVTGQATGAELMIWLNYHGGCCALQPGAPIIWIDGKRWWLSHWTAFHDGKSWNYVQYRRVWRTHHVHRLNLRPFMRRIEHLGLLKKSWWLENIEAGFEIWNGGQGLATTRYGVSGVRRPAP